MAAHAVGTLLTLQDGTTWRIIEQRPGLALDEHGYAVERFTEGRNLRTNVCGGNAIVSTAPHPEWAVGDEVTVRGQRGVILDRVPHSVVGNTYRVRLDREPSVYGNQPVEECWMHSYAIDFALTAE